MDVRELVEFREGAIPGAINIPQSRFHPLEFEPFRQEHIMLICHSGARAMSIALQLREKGFQQVQVTDRHMIDIRPEELSEPTNEGWSIDRQFRMTLGVLLALFLIGSWLNLEVAWTIPVILTLGLTITAAIDRCYLRLAIAHMPWNRDKEI
ncbi:MAG: rhodanese-like domain-containing protein [Saprospiraceae bacterium]